ncbi:Asp-tRNA(Asn)/Glu-tRNA(Gln) amidotransferase subunit GatC [Candidatus Chlorohelix sp.]|uniref:Asp-tRNA(Asn)/Glu-tRNA(Gln) amidotransferase subunit GatC n=1 Tax=Candidatus Chlorohelix sp. TaxID=3139201 RepID=UPI00304E3376
MKLSLEQIENVAHLARLQLTEAEKEKMREELAPILTYFEILKELDTDQISPTAQVIAVQNLMRPDEVRESAPISDALANAPMHEAGFFRIRAVFTEEE